jgi:ParB-like chromosome segregation protein Spo0J
MPSSSSVELQVKYRSIRDLSVNPQNARTHSKKQVNQLAESIRAFGFTNPVLLDQSDMVIAGHGRVAAAKQLKMLEVPTIRLDSLTPDQVRAYVLADNKLAELAGWDTEILAIELQYLTALEGDFEPTVTGFEIPEIDLLLSPQESIPDREDEIQDQGNSPAVAGPGGSDDAKKQTGNWRPE